MNSVPKWILERRTRGPNAKVGEQRLWASGLWEKLPDKTWKLVPGYRQKLRQVALTGKFPNGKKVPARDLRDLRKRIDKQGRPGCPKGKWANPETRLCIKIRKIKANVKKMLDRLSTLRDLPGTPMSKLVRATQEFKEWQDWYERSGAILAELSGMHKDLVIGVFSATSAATQVDANVTLGIKALKRIALTPPGEEPDFSHGFMGEHAKNIKRVLRGLTPTGPKVNPFTKALRGDPDAIPIDRHISYILFNKEGPDKKEHKLGQQILKKIADKIGIDGRDVQAALWALSITASGDDPQSYDQILMARKAEYDELIEALDDLRRSELEQAFAGSGWEQQFKPAGLREETEERLSVLEARQERRRKRKHLRQRIEMLMQRDPKTGGFSGFMRLKK